MKVWVWQWDGHRPNDYCFSVTEPTRAPEDNALARVHKGQLLANHGCPCQAMPDGLLISLPVPGELRQMDFQELRDKARDLPGHEEQTWVNLQMMLGG